MINTGVAPSILIVLMGALGDVVRGMSVADRIKEEMPLANITWLVEPKCRGIVELSESVDNVIVYDRVHPLRGIFSLRKALKAKKFDIVLDMQRHAKSGFFTWLSGAPKRIGFHPSNAKELNWVFQTEYISPADDTVNKFHHYQKFLIPLGIPEPVTHTTTLRGTRSEKIGTLPKPYVFVVLGSSWKSKDWVPQGYDKLLQELAASGMHAVLVGDRSKEVLSRELSEGRSGVSNLVGATSLSELVAVIRDASCGIGPDSGPGHIASAVNVPYVSLFGPTSPKRVSPIGSEHLVVTATIGCSPCYKRQCPGLDTLCMRLISVPHIIEKVRVATSTPIR